jgi:hypothetical protein
MSFIAILMQWFVGVLVHMCCVFSLDAGYLLNENLPNKGK